ncbi:bacteriocin [Staphylococcus aureus]
MKSLNKKELSKINGGI